MLYSCHVVSSTVPKPVCTLARLSGSALQPVLVVVFISYVSVQQPVSGLTISLLPAWPSLWRWSLGWYVPLKLCVVTDLYGVIIQEIPLFTTLHLLHLHCVYELIFASPSPWYVVSISWSGKRNLNLFAEIFPCASSWRLWQCKLKRAGDKGHI
jgi:hypothetical protein